MRTRLLARAAMPAAALLLGACSSLSPHVFSPCLRQDAAAAAGCSAQGDLAKQWEVEEGDVRAARAEYLHKVDDLAGVTPLVGHAMLGLGVFGLLRGVDGGGSRDITRAAILGTGAYGYGALAASPPRELVYLAGAEALSCTLAATEPWGRTIGDLGGLADDATRPTLRGRQAAARAALGELTEAARALKPLLDDATEPAVTPRCADRPACASPAMGADVTTGRRHQACLAAQSQWDRECRTRAATRLAPAPEAVAAWDRAQEEQPALAARLLQAESTVRWLDQAPGRLRTQSALIQIAVAKEVQKTAPDLGAVAAVAALVRREAAPPAPAAGASAAADAQSGTTKARPLSAADRELIKTAQDRTARAAQARLQLGHLIDDIGARTKGADEALARCTLSVPGVSLDVVPPDTAATVKPSGKLVFEVSGGTGVPTASALAGKVDGRLVDGRLRFEYTAPDQALDQPDTITFRDGARQARHTVRVTVQ